jgi:hypothetical protein
MIEGASSSNYHSMQVSARRRFAKGIQFGLAWTWSKAMGYNDDDVVNAAVADVSPLVSPRVWNYGLASFDRTHVLTINYLYDLPKTRWSFRPGRALLNDWQVSGITRMISGAPLGVSYATTVATDITGTPSQGARVVVTGDPVLPKDERTFSRNFRTEVIQMPAKGTFGNAAKTLFRGPGINTWDIAVFRNIPVKEGIAAQFRCEMYNAFNHTQFSDLNTVARFDPSGAQIDPTFGQFTAARRPRYIQLGLRFRF